jgi:DNA-binding Lrp family transcriptional regulator
MDAVDGKILAELQSDGRLTITELAERVQLSVSPCHRRLRALEQAGVIAGYRAHLNPLALGLGFAALIFVTMTKSDSATLAAFEEAIVDVPNIVQAQRLFGDPDFLLRVVAKDLSAFQQLYDSTLAALPGVQRLTSTLIMKSIVEDRALPI